jgi:hypothetical protein
MVLRQQTREARLAALIGQFKREARPFPVRLESEPDKRGAVLKRLRRHGRRPLAAGAS